MATRVLYRRSTILTTVLDRFLCLLLVCPDVTTLFKGKPPRLPLYDDLSGPCYGSPS